jgi:hypothetical protein
MNSGNNFDFSPDEFLDNWNSKSSDEKVEFLTNPSAATIIALTKFLKEFNESNKNVGNLYKDRNDALIELLKKGNRPTGEIKEIVNLIDIGIKDAAEDKNKNNNSKIKALVSVGGIVSIIAGATVQRDVKTRAILITVGGVALIGAVGSDTKTGKIIINALINIQKETKEAIEEIKGIYSNYDKNASDKIHEIKGFNLFE